MGPTAAMLPGNRLHLQHGPIDLIIGADGPVDAVQAAYVAARDRFRTILPVLVEELPALRRPVEPGQRFEGPVARRMADVVSHHTSVFVTPMAAVAGSVADEMLAALREAAPDLQKFWVNNGGDIGVHLSGNATFEATIIADPVTDREAGRLTLRAGDGVGGIATSGRHGRSLSLGIADAVTVLAENAASADVAATLIANEVDLPGHPAIHRVPACGIDPDSDLGERLVVVEVGAMSDRDVGEALQRGLKKAEEMVAAGHIHSANLSLTGISSSTGSVIPAPGPRPVQAPCRKPELNQHQAAPGKTNSESRDRTPPQGQGDVIEQEARHALT